MKGFVCSEPTGVIEVASTPLEGSPSPERCPMERFDWTKSLALYSFHVLHRIFQTSWGLSLTCARSSLLPKQREGSSNKQPSMRPAQ